MVTIDTVKQLALAYEAAEEHPHFDRISFRVKKKIFATIDIKRNRVTLKLSEMDQDIFSNMAKDTIYAVPNKWGKHGWTFIELETVDLEVMKGALTAAYCEVASKKLAAKYLGRLE